MHNTRLHSAAASRLHTAAAPLCAALAFLVPSTLPQPARAHGGASDPAHGEDVPAATAGEAVRLRGCRMTVALVPRPADALQRAFDHRLDLSQTFYGSDPLLGIWALACDRGRLAGERLGATIVSLVGVPVGLTSAGAPPLANNFAHALIRVDTSSPALAVALRRAGLPARLARRARYRHSPAGRIPFRGSLVVPGEYRLGVTAQNVDPTNPHDHVNRFEYRGPRGRAAELGLSTADAIDRFCLSDCKAYVRAWRGTALARLLGGRSAPVRAGFDHEKLARVGLTLPASRRRRG